MDWQFWLRTRLVAVSIGATAGLVGTLAYTDTCGDAEKVALQSDLVPQCLFTENSEMKRIDAKCGTTNSSLTCSEIVANVSNGPYIEPDGERPTHVGARRMFSRYIGLGRNDIGQ